MNTQTDRTAVEALLADYAAALNAANTAIIHSFYTEDGLLLPQGQQDLNKAELVTRSESFFRQQRFRIDYSLPETLINGDYAFVQTIAKTSSEGQKNGQVEEKTSRDFFVLKKENEAWKIFRYIFNNFN